VQLQQQNADLREQVGELVEALEQIANSSWLPARNIAKEALAKICGAE
jgi:hypothetical protein